VVFGAACVGIAVREATQRLGISLDTLRRWDAVTAEITAESASRLASGEGDLLVASWKATATRLVSLS